MKKHLRLDAFLRRLVVPAVFALSVISCCPAGAREYDPYAMYVFPAGGQRGTTIEGVMSRGRGLEGTTEIRISGQGVTAKVTSIEKPSTLLQQKSANRQDQASNPNVVKFTVTIAPDAEPGSRDLWLITPKGATNRLHFVVGQIPEVNEITEADKKGEPQPLGALPILVNGQYNQGDHDVFRFTAKAGETLVCEVQARKIVPYIADAVPGWFQPDLTLSDSAGNELQHVDDFRHHPDPLLIFKVEKDGEYLIEIKDVLFRGREDLIYRLSIGALPYITHIYPLGAQKGSTTQVELHGINLPAPSTSVVVPADSPLLQQVQTTGNGLISNSLPFIAGDTPETQEIEPNDAIAQATKIQTPVTINGRIQKPGDVDYLLFSAKKGERLIMDVRARRLESPLDSIITLLNTNNGWLAENDDTTDLSEGLITHHADSYLAYNVPADGDYVLRLADIQGNGGEEYAYRVTVAPPRMNFDLRIFPANLTVPRGATAMAKIKAYRRDGFGDEIRVAIEGLPPGFVASPASIPPWQNEVRFTITAPADAPLSVISPKLTGTTILNAAAVHAAKKAADDALAKVNAELGTANSQHAAAEKVAVEAEAAAAQAKTASAQAVAAHTAAQTAAAAKRQQADESKTNLDGLIAGVQKPAEAVVIALAKTLTDAAVAKDALGQSSAQAQAAASAQRALDAAAVATQQAQALVSITNQVTAAVAAHQTVEQAAQQAASAVAGAKVEADKAAAAQATLEKVAAEKRPPANAAKAARDKLAADQQAAAAKVAEAVKKLADATLRREVVPAEELMQAFYYWQDVPAEELLMAVVDSTFFSLTSNISTTEVHEIQQGGQLAVVVKASRDGLPSFLARVEAATKTVADATAKVKADLEKAKVAHPAAEQAAKEAEAAVAKADAAGKAQATQVAAERRKLATAAKASLDALVAADKAANVQLAAANKNVENAKAVANGPISLSAVTPPAGITVTAANLAANATEVTLTLTVAKQTAVGFRQNIIINGTLRAGGETITRTIPAIPIKVIAAAEKK